MARSLLEARRLIGPQMAAMAAAKLARDPAARAETTALLAEDVRRLGAEDDPVQSQLHALSFWDHVVDAADSIAFRLMFNSLRAAYVPALEALATVMAAEVDQVSVYEALADALTRGDEAAARRSAEELLEPVTAALIPTLELLESADPDSGETKED